jgi:hypothetical protein
MGKQFLYVFLAFVTMQTINAQTRGKLGYIDMEYILQKCS